MNERLTEQQKLLIKYEIKELAQQLLAEIESDEFNRYQEQEQSYLYEQPELEKIIQNTEKLIPFHRTDYIVNQLLNYLIENRFSISLLLEAICQLAVKNQKLTFLLQKDATKNIDIIIHNFSGEQQGNS